MSNVTVKHSNVKNLLSRFEKSAVYAGIPKGSGSYPDGTSVAQVAVDNEFGKEGARSYTSSRGNKVKVSGIPERSFVRSTAKEKRTEWKKFILGRVKSIISLRSTSEQALNAVGIKMSNDIKKKIVDIKSPANSPQVIADKGSSNPLIDTGHMLNSVTYDVRSK